MHKLRKSTAGYSEKSKDSVGSIRSFFKAQSVSRQRRHSEEYFHEEGQILGGYATTAQNSPQTEAQGHGCEQGDELSANILTPALDSNLAERVYSKRHQEGRAIDESLRKVPRHNKGGERQVGVAFLKDNVAEVATSSVQCRPRHTVSPTTKAPRKMLQLYIDLGQESFRYTTCHVCGMTYMQGEESDEKMHCSFHYTIHQRMSFAGWRGLPVAWAAGGNNARVVLAPSNNAKVVDTLSKVADELGLPPDWLLSPSRSSIKVFLYVKGDSRGSLSGCVVSEDIRCARRVCADLEWPRSLPDENDSTAHQGDCCPSLHTAANGPPANKHTTAAQQKHQQFAVSGSTFSSSRCSTSSDKRRQLAGMSEPGEPRVVEDWKLKCRPETEDAVCGIRAIWVHSEDRRQGIASCMLDAVRCCHFGPGYVIPINKLAFSFPTKAGDAFATRYNDVSNYLVYGDFPNV
ncbi:hypothetical protein CYMTET_33273 [Cymbomonas tetramitiformis]|uniref:Uncharacterized protein n=1 Tax=Cymbomonas tetramitiformis TaxID=36881 RepID=A0AAE0FDG2_9CHLO|nr:hypothetical protein CYMTET_33273 [Cymbomonas tetramitiformis]